MRATLFCLLLLLSGCSAFKTTPQPPPPPTDHAQEITKAQRFNLPELGTYSVTLPGSPDDALRAIKARADSVHAAYYLILALEETIRPGFWYATANLYGPPPASASASSAQ
ncbi:bioflm peroxide resistance protein BsmA [Izhakiella australiensis]|uniref:Bioflm peroxide resistance protein BsmA n=1 Tax=Izhakiella australiensis TaxID=1926881 RepID=A0A1S8YRV8_9GAMM|nr:biofilm peroxide resistance protein BsmA [Izhakiella australiensis]OON41800.1 bioflm peroxide resistance protein BsmA [Izhakiella australiensis]